MLQKCANPACSAQFRYLNKGRLLEVETQYRQHSDSEPGRNPKNGTGHVDLYWYCEQCAAHVALFFDRRQGLTMIASFPDSSGVLTTVLSQPSGRTGLEISRILIRPLDLDSTMTQKANRRMREAA